MDGGRRQQIVHGVGCYFSNQSLSQAVQRAVIDDLRLRTLRYPMFLQWEQAGGEFAVRDNDDPGQFDWAHYHRIFAKDREISTLQNRPNWFAGLRLLADHSERILVSACDILANEPRDPSPPRCSGGGA